MRWRWPATTAAVFALVVFVLAPNHPSGRRISEDAGGFFYAARELLTGGPPYLHVWGPQPPPVYVIDALWLALAVVLLWVRRRDAFRQIALIALSALATLALPALCFASRGAFGDMVDQAIRYNLVYASFTPIVDRLGAIPKGIRLTSPSGL